MRHTTEQLQLFKLDFDKPGQISSFSVRRSKRAKRLSIKVYPGGRVDVVVPKRTGRKTIQSFVEENVDWISRARESFAVHFSPEAFVIPNIVDLPAIDLKVIIRRQPKPNSSSVRYRFAKGILTLSGATENNGLCLAAVRRWLARVARREFEPGLRTLSALTGTPYERLQIRMQKTCWGSRSSSGTISLNLCLLFVSPDLLRYLMIHELCHGRYMNHSKRFWAMVGQYEPRYKRLDKDLGEAWRDVPVWINNY